MVTKRVGWALVIISACLFFSIITLNSLLKSRQIELSEFAQKYSYELASAKSNLSAQSSSIAEDATFLDNLKNQLVNSYSSNLSGFLLSESITNVGVYDQNCGLIFQNSLNKENLNTCRHKKEGKLYWIKNEDASTLSITRKLSSGHLVSFGLKISETWIQSILGDLGQNSLKVSYLEKESEILSLGEPIASYSPGEPIISDDNFITRHLASIISPLKVNTISSVPFFLFSLCAMVYLILSYIQDKASLENQMSKYSEAISYQSEKLNLAGQTNLVEIFSAWEKRFTDISTNLISKTHEITELENELKAIQEILIDQTKNESVNIQIYRTLSALVENFGRQKDTIDTIGALLHSGAAKHLTSVQQRMTDWKFNIDMKGPRKFLRSGFETMSSQNPNISIFEEELQDVLSGAHHLESSVIALIKEIKELESSTAWARKVLVHWENLLNEEPESKTGEKSIKISDSISQAISQLKIVNREPFSVETPSWTEPLFTAKAPSSVMVCLLFEAMNGLVTKDCENKIAVYFRSGSLRDQILVTKKLAKKDLSKEGSAKIQSAISKANSFAHAYDMKTKLLAGTGDHLTISISWNASSIDSAAYNTGREVEKTL